MLGNNSMKFEIFMIFPNFIQSYVLSGSATGEVTRIYQFFTKNCASFHLW